MLDSPASTKFNYRADIDGLRAIAVILVVLFHLDVAGFQGGFLGVDIFFVISGYLITSIITPKIQLGVFSFRDFYLGRVRRLIPPLLVTVTLTFLASALILDPNDLIAMAKSAFAAIFSIANILFFTEAGYWDAQSELKPLLHTWSLGIEEQFYLFWPLVVFGLCKLSSKNNQAFLFGSVTFIGLILSEWILRINSSAAFYLLPARFFEFSIGATFACLVQTDLWRRLVGKSVQFVFGVVGLLVLLLVICVYGGDTPFPGMNAILPCVATALVLMSGTGSTSPHVIEKLLTNPVMTWLGTISYSLYLVHWPILALMRYKVGLELHLHHQFIAIFLIGVLTLSLYYGVERKFSSRLGQAVKNKNLNIKKRISNGKFAIRTGISAVILSAVFADAALNSRSVWRYKDVILSPEKIEQLEANRDIVTSSACKIENYLSGPNCDNSKPLTVLVFGDSHEVDGINFLDGAFGDDPNLQIVRFGQINKCKTKHIKKIGLILDDKECQERVDFLTNSDFAKNIDILFYSSNRPFAPKEQPALDAIRQFKDGNPKGKVVAMLGYFVTEKHCSQLYNSSKLSKSCIDPINTTSTPENNNTDFLFRDFNEVIDAVVDRRSFLCSDDYPFDCESETPDGVIMMLDQSHHTFEFAQYAGKKFGRQNPSFLQDLLIGE